MGTRSKAYLIEFNKLVFGLNAYVFFLGEEFLSEFDYSPIEKCAIEVNLKLTKTENLYDLKFEFSGHAKAVCDTCAEDIDLPISHKFGLIIRLSETNNFDEAEIIYLARTEIEYDLKQFLYESLLLAVPQKKNCDGIPEPKPCNQEVLKRLNQIEVVEEGELLDEESEDLEDPRWDKLKDLLN